VGEPVGTGVMPACDDGGGVSPAQEVERVSIPGVSPEIAVGWKGQADDTVLVRDGIEEFPPELEKLMRAPGCPGREEPFELTGRWLGILGPDGNTESDLAPPYDLTLLVSETSAPRYDRAFPTVRVPPEAGEPLSRKDVRASLWEGGTITLSVECRGGRFVALGATAHPPA
jgi:hypothetical protein